jgi:hypothetical protein
MSVAEIIEEVKRMTPEERDEVVKSIVALQQPAEEVRPEPREVRPDDPGVAEAMDIVFKTHHELFRRLAQ